MKSKLAFLRAATTALAMTLTVIGSGVAAERSGAESNPSERGPIGEPHIYRKVGDRELKLFVVKPSEWNRSDRRPAIVFFHGGGFVGGSPGQFNEHARHFASRGMVGVLVEYRLLDRGSKALPVECIHDALSAMRWVRAHVGELGIDPRRIAAGGGSAGGHLAAFVGMVDGTDDPAADLKVSPKANALVLFNPVLDNGPGSWGHGRVGDRYKEFSPAHNVSPDDPPAIVFLGTADKLIPVDTMKRFQATMEKAGVRCEMRFYEGQPHGFFNYGRGDSRYFRETLAEADRFLVSLGWLKAP